MGIRIALTSIKGVCVQVQPNRGEGGGGGGGGGHNMESLNARALARYTRTKLPNSRQSSIFYYNSYFHFRNTVAYFESGYANGQCGWHS